MKCIKRIVEHNVNINEKDDIRIDAFLEAIKISNFEIIKVLVDYSQKNNIKMMKILLLRLKLILIHI